MKRFLSILVLLLVPFLAAAQQNTVFTPKHQFSMASVTTSLQVTTGIGVPALAYNLRPGQYAEQTLTYAPGMQTAVINTWSGFVKHNYASSVDNLTVSALGLTCTTNPTVLLAECGTSTTCASPTTIGSVQVTASGTATPATISNPTITAGDYTAWQVSGGSCTSLNVVGTAQLHAS